VYWFINFRHRLLHCELPLLSLANSRSRIHEPFELFHRYAPYVNKMRVAAPWYSSCRDAGRVNAQDYNDRVR
jgi:hypothetical protein